MSAEAVLVVIAAAVLVLAMVGYGLAVYFRDGELPTQVPPTLIATGEATDGTYTLTNGITLPYNASPMERAAAGRGQCHCGHPELKGIRHGSGMPCRVTELQGWPL